MNVRRDLSTGLEDEVLADHHPVEVGKREVGLYVEHGVPAAGVGRVDKELGPLLSIKQPKYYLLKSHMLNFFPLCISSLTLRR